MRSVVTEVRFYTDEHISKAVVRGLRQRNVDVFTVSDAAMMGRSDLDHLRFACGERRVIVTQDDDFLRLAAAGEPHSGIIYAPQRTSTRNMIRGLILIHRVLDADEMFGQIEFL